MWGILVIWNKKSILHPVETPPGCSALTVWPRDSLVCFFFACNLCQVEKNGCKYLFFFIVIITIAVAISGLNQNLDHHLALAFPTLLWIISQSSLCPFFSTCENWCLKPQLQVIVVNAGVERSLLTLVLLLECPTILQKNKWQPMRWVTPVGFSGLGLKEGCGGVPPRPP